MKETVYTIYDDKEEEEQQHINETHNNNNNKTENITLCSMSIMYIHISSDLSS